MKLKLKISKKDKPDSLIDQAIKRGFNINVKFKSPENNKVYTIINKKHSKTLYPFYNHNIGGKESLLALVNDQMGEYIFYEDKWAEILKDE